MNNRISHPLGITLALCALSRGQPGSSWTNVELECIQALGPKPLTDAARQCIEDAKNKRARRALSKAIHITRCSLC